MLTIVNICVVLALKRIVSAPLPTTHPANATSLLAAMIALS
ncbi:MAG TPA: hypothetical protein VKB53_05575 [Gammaproteobacteria bacterium]|nr:hypothetical protein [Gammaproteobacteria bacterium]